MSNALAHTNDPGAADQRADARRPQHLDAGAVGALPGMGAEPEGLRAAAKEEKAQKRGERDEGSYILESGLKLLKVLEALEGSNFEPVNITRVVQRTGFNQAACRAYLITLKKAGWAKEVLVDPRERTFILGPRAQALAKRLSANLLSGQ